MSDQFALAVLRLQHGLNETNTRLSKLEAQMASRTNRVASGGGDGRVRGGNKLIDLLSRMDSLHWFYLSYPIVVYALFRLFERRGKQPER